MRILADSRMLYRSGIGRYVRSILSYMSLLDETLFFDLWGDFTEIQQFIDEVRVDRRRFHHSSYTPAIYSLREQVEGSIRMSRIGSDIIHIPHFNAPRLLPVASVVTVHDLIPFKFPDSYSLIRLEAARQVLKNAVEKAARVIVVSDSTATDLTDMFPNKGIHKKIRRTYLGVSDAFNRLDPVEVEEFKLRYDLGDYVLYVGNRLPHKNLGRLAESISILQHDFPELQLVVAGNRLRDNDELDKAKRSGKGGVIIEWGPANDNELKALYSGARVLAFPSLYEGFGLPVLEAMACGTPVVVSNNSSLPEVAGQAGVFINPYNADDIARGISEAICDSIHRARLSVIGLEQASRFRWEETARQTRDVYREVASL